ncbi:formyltetrahydrofolate deformylase [Paracoccus tegillarcae]|uniref:Formyltetrahydrofolate deformylase n=1 Tax=Paracoccus tegillarcae TaxID=1529068 RepID=A0A2K9F4V3_9RHOB|nr:formyltetrahydrofolate deformylase [Paracoccus tegillarcae]AUH35432.1 formyltetrahydrofolate deformylase [Paracoccus tegillarcae]
MILRVSCRAQPGIVAAITAALADCGANLVESNQFWDEGCGRFFLRVSFLAPVAADIAGALMSAREAFDLDLDLAPAARKPRLIVMVSKFDHALLHLLYQAHSGWLNAEICAIVSNHPDAEGVAAREGVPFHHWPVTRDTKPEIEARLVDLADALEADLVVLARYMQILSDDLARKLSGRAINIHHSFLPSFKGAKPYHQAHARGVKHIGATAHYVTGDLDEGPIIEQDVERVSHTMMPDDLVAIGRDIESRVLARAVKLHLEGRVFINGAKTVVL